MNEVERSVFKVKETVKEVFPPKNKGMKYKVHQYYVYFMASISRVLYIGVTNDLPRRVTEHKRGLVEGFSKQYHCDKLVYCEYYQWIQEAIAREDQLKGWSRKKKTELIEKDNPNRVDLTLNW